MAEPKVRFKRDDGSCYPDWKEEVLGDVLSISQEKNGTRYGIEDILSVSDEHGILNQIRFHGRSFAGEDISGYKVVHTGQIVYTRSPLSLKPYGIIKIVGPEEGVVSPLYIVNDVKIGNDPLFIYYFFDSPIRTNNYLKPLVRMGAKHTMNISNDEWLSGLVYIPQDNEEQQKIADFLSSVDTVIASSEEEVNNLESQKKAVLKEIFTQTVRFKKPNGGDYPDWDFVKMSSLGNCKNGMNYRASDMGTQIAFLGVGDFKDKMRICNISELSCISLNEDLSDDYLLADGDIVFVRSNGNKELVGRCLAVYPERNKVTFSGFCIRFRLESDEVINDFLLQVLKTEPMRKAMQGRGSDIHNLNQEIIGNLDIPVPCPDEQRLIAEFLSDFDEAIAAAKRELELWKELKKGLLQQMFV